MMSPMTNIQRLEGIYRTSAISVLTEISAKVITDQVVRKYLDTKALSWLSVLDNGEILFHFEFDDENRKIKIEEIAQIASFLSKHGFVPVPRPCEPALIKLLVSQNAQPTIVKRSHQNQNITLVTDNTIGDQESRSEVQHLLDNIVDAASKAGSSDIHIETDEKNNKAVFKFRVDGKLTEQTASALMITERTATKLGAMIIGHEAHTGGGSTSDTFDKNKPINGSFTITTEIRTLKLRYSHTPTAEPKGLSIVMRIVTGDGKGSVPTFRELHYSASEIALLERMFKFPDGVILFTGPTGSGKSSAMAAGTTLFPKTYKVISVEDPVESKLPNVCQIQIGNNEHTSYASYARTLLRQDPDVIIYGEIRDPVVMQNAIDQANTGHLILSTLHTNTPADSIKRLVSLGSDVDTLAHGSLIRALVGQRLVEKLCPHCKVPLIEVQGKSWVTVDHRRVLSYFSKTLPEKVNSIFTKNLDKSCNHCKGEGEKGRLPLVEIIMVDNKGRDFIRNKDITGWLAYLRQKKWKDLQFKATDRIVRGEICPLSAELLLNSPFGVNIDEFDYEEFDQLSTEATEC